MVHDVVCYTPHNFWVCPKCCRLIPRQIAGLVEGCCWCDDADSVHFDRHLSLQAQQQLICRAITSSAPTTLSNCLN